MRTTILIGRHLSHYVSLLNISTKAVLWLNITEVVIPLPKIFFYLCSTYVCCIFMYFMFQYMFQEMSQKEYSTLPKQKKGRVMLGKDTIGRHQKYGLDSAT